MANVSYGIAPEVKTHAAWVSANPTLGATDSGDTFGGLVIATGSTYGTIMVYGTNQSYNTAFAAGQYVSMNYIPFVPGVRFPATQVVSGDANTLDDYEKGTFTADLQFGGATTGITYGARSARYTKIGRTVSYNIFMSLSSKGSAVGNATIAGLPFMSGGYYIVPTYYSLVSFSGVFESYINPSNTEITLFEITTGGTRTNLDNTNFSNTSLIIISGTYEV